MTEKMYTSQIIQESKGFKGFVRHLATLKLNEIEKQKENEEDDVIIVGHNLKLQTIQDERNAQYFMNLLSRRVDAVQEYTTFQKALQR